jgi:oligopeptide/dipeptide ABC transporter ATP-binding protein
MKELLRVQGVKKYFPAKGRRFLKAVDDVSFSISHREIFGLVGESGCGKSTLARLILRLMEPTEGQIFFNGLNVTTADGRELSEVRRGMQIIFQDPLASLNPRMKVMDTIGEALLVNNLVKKGEIKDRVIKLLDMVGLDTDVLYRYPHEFSGGQRQRICIARALAVSPEIIVADEALSALDVSIQAQIMNLLEDLQRDTGMAYLFISHNLLAIEHFSDVVAVMYLGRIVEMSGTEALFKEPMHPYTEALLSSIPRPEIRGDIKRTVLDGDVPSQLAIPPGCPFHPRCPKRFEPCDRKVPEYKEARDRRWVACHLWS